MNRLQSLLSLSAALILGASSLAAQDQLTSVTVRTSIPGIRFSVDGTIFRSAASFSWPQGSHHVLDLPPGEEALLFDGIRQTFMSWSDTGGTFSSGQRSITVVAGSSITTLVANFSKEYRVTLQFADGRPLSTQGNPTCGSAEDPSSTTGLPGVVSVNNACFWTGYSIWMTESVLSLQATPFPGFVFAGWSLNNGEVSSYITSIAIKQPQTIVAKFVASKRTQFMTQPAGLRVLVDHNPVATPSGLPCQEFMSVPTSYPIAAQQLCYGEFDFRPGSRHLIGAPTPQEDKHGKKWVFDKFANGAGQNSDYVAAAIQGKDLLTANFVPGITASLGTEPSGLKLTVEGQSNLPAYNFIWGVGMKYSVSAPTEQADRQGRKYVFVSWSNGGAQSQDIVVEGDAAQKGIWLIAKYRKLNRAVIQSTIPGTLLNVDGKSCPSPCTIDRAAGTEIRVGTPEKISVSNLTRFEFTGWSDGTKGETTIKLDKDYQTLGANYITKNRLMVVSDPANGADIVADPASADGFYPDSSGVKLIATAKPGYKFKRWLGDLDSTYNQGYVEMNTPRTVRAFLERVPYIAPAGVRNAAGTTPEGGVAAGSLISVYGESLATVYEAGPTNPLAQTIAGTVVLIDDRLLQIVYVSPEQINALLPIELSEGDHKLIVRNTASPDISADFTVVRNAPGLFSSMVEDKAYAIALHEDGTVITLDSPAKHGERVTLLGTGFGPYDRKPVEGFALPEKPQVTLVDNAELAAGDLKIPTIWSGAAPGFIGVSATRFRVADELPSGAPELRIYVNGKESNKVLLPVQ